MVPDRFFSQSVSLDSQTFEMVGHLIETRQFSVYVRALIHERNEQETVPGLRAAVVKLISEYKQANGIGEA